MSLINESQGFLYSSNATTVGNITMSTISILISILVIIFIIYVVFKLFEKSKPNVEYVVLLAFLTATASVGRLVGLAIPGIQFATFIIIMAAVVFGKETGVLVGMLTAIVSDFVIGIGFWLPYQMLAWGIIGYLAGYFSNRMEGVPFRVIFGFLTGFIFGWITNVVMFYYLAEINLTTIIGVYLSSIVVDALHGACTAICLFIAYNWCKKSFLRTKKLHLD